MSYSLRSKGRAPTGDLEAKKRTPRKSRQRRSTDDGTAADDGASETDSNAISCSETEDSCSTAGSPFVGSSPFASLIEKSWKSGIAELVGKKSGDSKDRGKCGDDDEDEKMKEGCSSQ